MQCRSRGFESLVFRRFFAICTEVVCMGFARIARGCLLMAWAAGLVGSASAGGMVDLGVVNGSVGKILKSSGIDIPDTVKSASSRTPSLDPGIDSPDTVGSTYSNSPSKRRAAASTDQDAGPLVSGLIIRFSSPDAKRLSRENLPPAQALIDEINELAKTTLV